MTEHLKNFLDGVRQSLTLAPTSGYNLPNRGDFQHDADSLRSDVTKLSIDMRKAIKKAQHGR